MLSSQEYIAQFDAAEHLAKAPRTYAAPAEFVQPGLKALFYESAPYQGKNARCFAWVGLPEGACKSHPVPGIVLVHGGGGTALANWVRHWNSLGFAAISMDTCGCVPCWSATPGYHPCWPRHAHGGAPGWGDFGNVDLPLREQWPYQAAAAVLRGTALLRSLPEVDASRIGIAGISWGGVLTLIASSVAPQGTYRFAIPVYASCGFTADDTSAVTPADDPAKVKKWAATWDPAPALKGNATPMLFLTDAEDFAFALPTWQKTTEMPAKGAAYRSARIFYNHNHEASMHSKTEESFARAMLSGGKLPTWGKVRCPKELFAAKLAMNGRRIVKCRLCYTRAEGVWADHLWREKAVRITGDLAEAERIPKVTAAFFTVTDDYGCIWSSEVVFPR